jgi:hypothetical protein
MNLEKLKSLLKNPEIEVLGLSLHTKASEMYVEVKFTDKKDSFAWQGLIPYHYRRTATFIETEEELAIYLEKIKPYFAKEAIEKWIEQEKKHWEDEMSGKVVTKPFFDELAKLKWVSQFRANDNPQSRLKNIKDLGYTIASRPIGVTTKREFLLVPIPRHANVGYETFSTTFRKKALKVLKNLNVYELSEANKAGLLPDHKFPEIRWDSETKSENPDTMTDEDIKNKFQLIDNQRNQQKREVCRSCFQTNKRGIIFGIRYFYEGDENWETNFTKAGKKVEKIGKDAELGCVGCAWYDIEKWRESLNKTLKTK